MKRPIVVVAALLAGAGSHALSQQAPPTFRSGRDVLTVEASVRDSSGRPVTDLQASDFLVSIDGQPRRVLDARLFSVDADRITAPVTPLPRFARAVEAAPGRLVVVAVDRDSIQPGSERAVLETTSAMLASLSPADAVGAIGLPIGGIEPTRDHAAAAAAIRLLTGTRPRQWWRYNISWDEALNFERGDSFTIARVRERECVKGDPTCAADLQRQAQEMLLQGRGQVHAVLKRLGDLLDRLSTIRAPKHLVLLSGGLPFDQELVSRYLDLAAKAAQARVALFVVHIDQPSSDASDLFNASTVFGGREYRVGAREYRLEHRRPVRQRCGPCRRRLRSHRLGHYLLLSTGGRSAAVGCGRQDASVAGPGQPPERVGPRAVGDRGRAGPEAVR